MNKMTVLTSRFLEHGLLKWHLFNKPLATYVCQESIKATELTEVARLFRPESAFEGEVGGHATLGLRTPAHTTFPFPLMRMPALTLTSMGRCLPVSASSKALEDLRAVMIEVAN